MTLIAGSDEMARQPVLAEFENVFGLLLETAGGISPAFSGQPSPKCRLAPASLLRYEPVQLYRRIQSASYWALRNCRIARMAKGYLGIMPRDLPLENKIAVSLSGHVAFVVCETSDSSL